MKPSLETTYSIVELAALVDANQIVATRSCEVVYCYPAWRKMHRIGQYLKARQAEIVAEALADPDAAEKGSAVSA